MVLAQGRRDQGVGEVAADQVLDAVPERALRGLVGERDPPVRVHGHDAVQRGVDDGPPERLVGVQRRLEAQVLADPRAEAGERREQLGVGLLALGREELDRPVLVEREAERGAQAGARGRARPGQVGREVGEPGRAARCEHAARQAFADPQPQPARRGHEAAVAEPGRRPGGDAAQPLRVVVVALPHRAGRPAERLAHRGHQRLAPRRRRPARARPRARRAAAPRRRGAGAIGDIGDRCSACQTAVPHVNPELPYAIMGVVNVTPDSFSDGGAFEDADAAIAHAPPARRPRGRHRSTSAASRRARAPIRSPSTRSCGACCRWSRASPGWGCRRQISIDTMKAPVAEAALDAGATLRQRRHRLPPRPRAWRASSPTAAWTAA